MKKTYVCANPSNYQEIIKNAKANTVICLAPGNYGRLEIKTPGVEVIGHIPNGECMCEKQ